MNVNHALGVRSHFSIGESMMSPKQIIANAKKYKLESVALVDTMTISSMVSFTKEAKAEGIKPIIGCRLRVVDDPTYRKPKKNSGEKEKPNAAWFPKVYVKNAKGMQELMQLLTLGNSEEYFYYAPRIGFDDLLKTLSGGNLIFSTGDFYSILHRNDYADKLDQIRTAVTRSQTFIEVVPVDTPLFDTLNIRAMKIAELLDIPTLLTIPMLYTQEADADTLDVLSAITTNTKMSAPWRSVPYIRDFAMKEPGANIQALVNLKRRLSKFELFESPLMKQAVDNMSVLVDACEYEWKKQEVTLPKMAENEMKALIDAVKIGWVHRLDRLTMGYMPPKEKLPEYKERLQYELSTLKNMGFERYFLVVQDLVDWSKSNGILVGPGRGSVGGSLVAYLLGITDVDPIRFNLIFERFINPDRLDLPDADLDFMSSRRSEVIDYLVERYGQDRVAGISNYSTLASSSALRDAGRIHDMSQTELACSKYVPKEHGSSVTLNEAAAAVPEIAAFKEEHLGIWTHATKLEGRMRSLGQHAAGIVVAGEPISNRAVIERRSNTYVVNWDKRVVEDWGFVKLDILGLSTLDIISKSINMIKERQGVNVVLTDIALDDKKVYEEFAKGNTVGIFQFESGGMRKLLKDLGSEEPLTFDEIAAATALYRPGPMDAGLLDDYVAIKKGYAMPFYEHENMEASLSSTGSVLIYQEQVMQLARDLAGFTMTDADHLRKAMGKKDMDMMIKQRDKWVAGCKSHSAMDERVSEMLFDKIEKFAGYAFNLSHSVEYSIISYWAMWLKVNYRSEFYAAAMSVTNEDKLTGLVKDAESNGVFVMPANINKSGLDFVIEYDNLTERTVLHAPFNRLKGLSDNTTKAILDAREKLAEKVQIQLDDGSYVYALPSDRFETQEDGKTRTILEIMKAMLTPVL
jgi:DNA polymerase-3 subunit alpha